ncbi:MAG: plasmid partitioning protein RepB [Rhodoblastus sp.]|nr:plasmid partitioning protein RepB [Rhodoblastus sp.]
MFDKILARSADEADVQVESLSAVARRMGAVAPNLGPAKRMNEVVAGARDRMSNAEEYRKKAEELDLLLRSGDRVVEVLPDLIDPSPVRDRFPSTPAEDEAFVESMRSGQKVPALLRPNPAIEGRYLTIYGHRRTAACRVLGRPVRAVIVEMADEEAFVAQGVENNERRNLTWIERAVFALRLNDAGMGMKAIGVALGTGRTHVVTMIGVARDLPLDLIMAVGRAPELGEPRWAALRRLHAEAVEARGAKEVERVWRGVVADAPFGTWEGPARLDAVAAAIGERDAELKAGAPRSESREIVDGEGGRVARFEVLRSGEARMRFGREESASFRADGRPFAEWLAERLVQLREEWRKGA